MKLIYEPKYWFSNFSNYIPKVAFIVSLLLLMPKMDLIPISGTSPIRIDDLILLFMGTLLFINFLHSKRKNITEIEWLFIILLIYMVFSNILNLLLFDRSNILFSIRNLEYFIFFYTGYYFSKKHSFYTLLKYYLFITGAFVIIQILGYNNGIITGLTAGPWELGAVLNIVLIVYAFNKNNTPYIVWKIFFVTTLFILLTGSRSPLAANIFLFLCYIFFSSSRTKKILVLFLMPFVAFIIYIVFSNISLPVKDRSEKLFSYDNIELVETYYDNVQVSPLGLGFDNTEIKQAVDRNVGDMSWAIRSLKWVYSIKLWLADNVAIWIGVGPGTLGQAVDGGIIRVLCEFGLVGFIIFIYFLYRVSIIYGTVAFYIVVALLINMLMIDVHNSYKVMSLFYFIIGALEWNKNQKINI